MMKTLKYNNFLFFLILLLVTGCFEERMSNAVWDTELLEWEPPSRATNALNYAIDLEADQTENYTFELRLQYAGPHQTENLTGAFAVDQENSDAIEGEHFNILTGTSVTIPAGTNFSEEIEIEVLPANIENGESLNIVLVITDEGDVPPMENYKEFNIIISKDDGFIDVLEIRLDRPGFLAGENMLDVATGTVYSKNAANDDTGIQAIIDLGLWNSSSSELTMILPTNSDRLGGWGSGRTIRDEWADENKNDGVLFKLPVSADNIDVFENILSGEDLIDVYNATEESLSSLELDANDYGPGGHLQYLRTGELIFFKSLDRNIYAVAYIDAAVSAGDGYADLLLKRYIIEGE